MKLTTGEARRQHELRRVVKRQRGGSVLTSRGGSVLDSVEDSCEQGVPVTPSLVRAGLAKRPAKSLRAVELPRLGKVVEELDVGPGEAEGDPLAGAPPVPGEVPT